MNGAFYIGAIGLDTQQRALEVVANNVANINTAAFKRSSVRFTDLVTLRGVDDAAPLPDDASAMAGVMLGPASRVWAQGTLRQTGGAFDVAIDGDGFVEVMGTSGKTLLWRGGTLKVNQDGYLATIDGTPLRAMISVPRDASGLTIGRDGTVSAILNGEGDKQEIGQIDLVTAKSPDLLASRGGGYFEAADEAGLMTARPGDDGAGVLVQGSLEGSNAQLADEMTDLLLMQRAFGANAQIVQAGDQIMAIVNGLRR